jgi:ABC transporter ATM
VLSSIVFHVIPTALEISMVCGILVCGSRRCRHVISADVQSWKFGWDFAAVTAITMGLYSWFTVTTTAWR